MNIAAKDLIKAKERLINGGYTCVLYKSDDIRTSVLRGVRPLVELMESGESFDGYCAADKVVGKATAFLYILLGIRALYADVISIPALTVLKSCGIYVEYQTAVDNIINRKGDGICPFEQSVLNTDDPHDAYIKILKKMKELQIK